MKLTQHGIAQRKPCPPECRPAAPCDGSTKVSRSARSMSTGGLKFYIPMRPIVRLLTEGLLRSRSRGSWWAESM